MVYSLIEIFVCSRSAYVDIGTVREMIQHTLCAPGTASALVKDIESKFKGRILPSDDQRTLELIGRLTEIFHDEVKVYDVSRIIDKLKAIRRGVSKTPAVVINGKKYEGLKKS